MTAPRAIRLFVLLSTLAVFSAAALSSGPALAAKGGVKGANLATTAPSITLNEADPHLGSDITFAVTYPSQVKYPRVAVRCYQDGSMVYAEAGPSDHVFLLGGASSNWLRAGGSASCTAELFYIIWNGSNTQEVVSLAWTSFSAAG
jgi:hypothetical protein